MQNMLLVLHLLICVVLVGAADMMVNITSWVGGAFFVTSIFLTVLAGARPVDRSVITDGQKPQSGIQLNIPFLNGGAPKKNETTTPITAPSPALPEPSAPSSPIGASIGAAVAPTPVEAVTRAGPIDPAATPNAAAPKAAPATSLPNGSAQRLAAPVVAGPVGATPKTVGPVGAPAPKTQRPAPVAQRQTPAPMIPLPAQPIPGTAPATESPQPATPAPEPRDRTGPDE
jgi:hypothetical protein